MFFKPSQFTFIDQPYDVLIADCGTGHQAMYAALDFPNARVTAVDLSASSLAYASKTAQRYDTKYRFHSGRPPTTSHLWIAVFFALSDH
jgi:ubiquinone/menaquinone biosynthesis C-methylase UbiE